MLFVYSILWFYLIFISLFYFDCQPFPSHCEGDTNVKAQHLFLDNGRGIMKCRGGSHPSNCPTDKWPSPKVLRHTCGPFAAHQCAGAHWLKITTLMTSSSLIYLLGYSCSYLLFLIPNG